MIYPVAPANAKPLQYKMAYKKLEAAILAEDAGDKDARERLFSEALDWERKAFETV